MSRLCHFVRSNGKPCRAAPLIDGSLCFFHDPEYAAEAAEARRIGGLRRRNELTIIGAYDLNGLDTVDGIRRILEIAVSDGLGLDNGIQRIRALISAASVGARLLETGELEARLRALESARDQGTRGKRGVPDGNLLDGSRAKR